MEQNLIDRVIEMEARYDRVILGLVGQGEIDREDLDTLRKYLDSGQWQKDFEADEAGEIPVDIKRGVLSEDGLYNLLEEVDEL